MTPSGLAIVDEVRCLVPASTFLAASVTENVDGRNQSGHDDEKGLT